MGYNTPIYIGAILESTRLPSEPNIRTWLTKDKKEKIYNELAKARKRLIHAGVWNKTLSHWVQEEIAREIHVDDLKRELIEIDERVNKWSEDKLRENYFENKEELKAQLAIVPAIRVWCRKQWENRIDTLYLEHKSKFDMARCRMIRISDKELAWEIYLRIKEGEVEFGKAAREYGEGEERNNNGEFKYQQASALPFGLGDVLKRLEVGKITKPLRMSKWFCVIELLEYKKSVLNENTSDDLLAGQLRIWVAEVVRQIEGEIQWEK